MKMLLDLEIDKEKLVEGNVVERIAEAYKVSPDQLWTIHHNDKQAMHKLIAAQFHQISKRVYFEFVPFEPYSYTTAAEIMADYNTNKRIQVNTTGNNSNFWGEAYNLMFRAIHDYFHAAHQLDFNYIDEVEAFTQQVRHSMFVATSLNVQDVNWKLFAKVLRSEIVYQAAYKTHFNKFHLQEQKIILKDL